MIINEYLLRFLVQEMNIYYPILKLIFTLCLPITMQNIIPSMGSHILANRFIQSIQQACPYHQ